MHINMLMAAVATGLMCFVRIRLSGSGFNVLKNGQLIMAVSVAIYNHLTHQLINQSTSTIQHLNLRSIL
jgi:hypothetical protein